MRVPLIAGATPSWRTAATSAVTTPLTWRASRSPLKSAPSTKRRFAQEVSRVRLIQSLSRI